MESVARKIVRRLREAGHRAFFAGGCVRDALMGKTPHDFDIATSARPEEVQALFPRTIPSARSLVSFWSSRRAAITKWRLSAQTVPIWTAAIQGA